MAIVRPPVWASLPFAQLQLKHMAPIAAYHQYRPRSRAPEHLMRGLFTLGIGLAGVLGMVLYEMGYTKTAFTWSITAATVGTFVAAAEVMSAYSVPEIPEITSLAELA